VGTPNTSAEAGSTVLGAIASAAVVLMTFAGRRRRSRVGDRDVRRSRWPALTD
jgi:hypothetical protein